MGEGAFDTRGEAVLAVLAETDGQVFVHEEGCAIEWDNGHEFAVVPCDCDVQVVTAGVG